jgi:hypothetical protein
MSLDARELSDEKLKLLFIYIRLGFKKFEEIKGGETPLNYFDAFVSAEFDLEKELLARGYWAISIEKATDRYQNESDFTYEDLLSRDYYIDPVRAARIHRESLEEVLSFEQKENLTPVEKTEYERAKDKIYEVSTALTGLEERGEFNFASHEDDLLAILDKFPDETVDGQ